MNWSDSARERVVRARAGLLGSDPVRVLTAASSPVVRPEPFRSDVLTPDALRARRQGWQLRVLELADMIPEVAGAANFVENSLSLIKVRVEGGDPGRGGTATMRSAMERSLNHIGLGRTGKLIFLSGEAYNVFPDGELPFSASIAEFDLSDPSKPMISGPNGERRDVQSSWQFMRIWRESNSNRLQATSAHKACMELLESMYVAQIADSSAQMSRLATAGILIWPMVQKRMGMNPETGRPFPGSQEEVVEDFADAARQAISAKNALAAATPYIQAVDIGEAEKFFAPELLRIDKSDAAENYKVKFEMYNQRYAQAIDLPIEQITGLGNTRAQGANLIREDTYRSLRPTVDLIVGEWQRRLADQYGFTLVVDASELLEKPDNSELVMQLLQLQQIDIGVAEGELGLPAGSLLEAPARDYSSNVVRNPPSDLRVGGDRGGGRFRER